MKKRITGYFKGYSEKDDLIQFAASTNAIDREGESIDANGWDLSNIGKNLPLLWSHMDRELPIGKVVSAHIEGNTLLADVEFAHKIDEFAKRVYELVRAGFLNAVSVGFLPKAYNNEGQMIQQELLELSVVNVPANQEALRSNMYQAFTKALKEMDDKEVKPEEKLKPINSEPEKKEVEKVDEKEGRIISEKNRNTVRIAMDAMGQAQTALSDLLNATEPPAKKGGVDKIEPVNNVRKQRLIKSVRLADRVFEGILHELKEGGEK